MASEMVLEGSKIGRFGGLPSRLELELLGRTIVGTPSTDGPSACLVLWGLSLPVGSREGRVGVRGEGRGSSRTEVAMVLLGPVGLETVFENVLRL